MVTRKTELAVVYKPVEYTDSGREALSKHAAELAHFGVTRIISSRTTILPTIGLVTVFAIADREWQALQQQVVGAFGFRDWRGSELPALELDSDFAIGPARRQSVESVPVLLRELIGRPCRLYRTNDGLDRSHDPRRVNIECDSEGRVSSIWFG